MSEAEALALEAPRGVRSGPWRRRALPLLLLLLLGLRLPQALSARGHFDNEEGFTLTAAYELLHDPAWPYQAYQLSDTEGGSLVTVLLCLPFCALLGPSLLALKLTALTITCATLCGLFLLCREAFGLRAAAAACLIYVLFPSPIYAYSLTAHGFHPDAMALQAFFLWGLCVCYARGATPRRAFGVGVLGGASVYFAYISAMAVLAGVGAWLWLRARGRARHRLPWLALAAGGCVGLLPWLAYNALNDFRGLSTYHGRVTDYILSPLPLATQAQHFAHKTLDYLVHFSRLSIDADPAERDYSRSDFLPIPYHAVHDLVFWAVALPALLSPLLRPVLARLAGRRAGADVPAAPPGGAPPPAAALYERAALLLVLLTVGVFFTSGHPVYPWHMVPMLVVLITVTAARLTRMLRSGRRARVVLAAALLLGAVSYGVCYNLRDIHPGWMGVSAALDGRNYPERYRRLEELAKTLRRPDLQRSLPRLFEAVPHHMARFELAWPAPNIEALLRSEAPMGVLSRLLTDTAGAGQGFVGRRVAARALATMLHRDPARRGAVVAFLRVQRPGVASALLEEVGALLGPASYPALSLALAELPAVERRRWSRRLALGMGRGADLLKTPSGAERCDAAPLPAELWGPFFQGLGWSTAQRLVTPATPGAFSRHVCPSRQGDFLRGLRSYEGPRPWRPPAPGEAPALLAQPPWLDD